MARTSRTTRSFCLKSIGLAVAAALLPGCNAGPLLKTGSLNAAPVAAPAAATPIDRALHVGATSARAQKCGFYFDPATLRANFLAAEAARGTTAEALAKTGQSYDYTVKTITSKITKPDAYCSSNRTATIKTALQAALAGNYEPPVKKPEQQSDIWGNLLEGNGTTEKFNRDHVYDPLLNPDATKKAE